MMQHAGSGLCSLCAIWASAPRGGIVEVERTKHLYQADEFFGLGIKGVAGAWRLAELIDVGRSQRLHDQPALVLIDFDVVAHLILLNAAGPRPRRAIAPAPRQVRARARST